MTDLVHGQEVLVDGIPGWIAAIHPNGKGVYVGEHHAYVWVRTPSLDFREYGKYELTRNGRAVPFNEIKHRIKIESME